MNMIVTEIQKKNIMESKNKLNLISLFYFFYKIKFTFYSYLSNINFI